MTIVGLATDYCVRHTATDALREALIVTIDPTAVRGIDDYDSQQALSELGCRWATVGSTALGG